MAQWQETHPEDARGQEQRQGNLFDEIAERSARAEDSDARATVRRHDGHRRGGHPHKKGR
jgi:hypothetical protein